MKLKKIAALTFILFSMAIPAVFAATSAEFSIGETDVYSVEDTIVKKTIDVAPYVKNDRTMVPVRAVCETLGFDVSWNDSDMTINIAKNDKNIVLNIGKSNVFVNGQEKQIDCAPEITDNRAFVPLRAVSENLGYYVYYISSTGQILIDEKPPVMNVGDAQIPYSLLETVYNYNYADEENMSLAVNETYDFLSNLYSVSSAAENANVFLSEEEKNALVELEKSIKKTDINELKFLPAGFVKIQQDYMIASNYMEQIYNSIDVDDEEFKNLYEKDYVCAKHVLISNSEDDAQALQTANEVYNRALMGEDFDLLISQYGEDPGMNVNTNGYVFSYGEMVSEFEETAFALEIGAVSKPVKTYYGYHVILRLPLPLDKDSVESVKQNIIYEKYQEEVADIYKNVSISVNISESDAVNYLSNK